MVRRIVISISRLDYDEARCFTFCGIRDIKRSVFQSVKTSKVSKREKWLLQIEEKARTL